jgi:hypothetical protein
MKTIGLTLLFLLNCTTNQAALDEKYKKAYSYVQTAEATRKFSREIRIVDSLACIAVSDSVVFLDNFFFLDDIIEYEYKGRVSNLRALRDSLITAEYRRSFSTFFLPSLSDLASCRNARMILFFSKPDRNTLTAELLPYDGSKKSFLSIAQFNRSLGFLFYFTPQDSIETVFIREFQND